MRSGNNNNANNAYILNSSGDNNNNNTNNSYGVRPALHSLVTQKTSYSCISPDTVGETD
ncbi:MAG: hypothetical protein K2L42_02915 [Clostridia bacterium]|nr:hypothetical protein [Clostridia bacterium]